MNPVVSEKLRERFRLEEWRGRTAEPAGLFLMNFRAGIGVLPGWTLHRLQQLNQPGMPRLVESVWRPENAQPPSPHSSCSFAAVRPASADGPLLRLDVYECDSRPAAHEFVIALLGQLQSPNVNESPDFEVGDVAFRSPSGMYVLFARANFVLFLSNAGRPLLDLLLTAKQLDALLSEQPDVPAPQPRDIAEGGRRSMRIAFAAGDSVPLPAEVYGSLESGDEVFRKIFFDCGLVQRSEGKLSFTSAEAGPARITIYDIAADRQVQVRTVEVDAPAAKTSARIVRKGRKR